MVIYRVTISANQPELARLACNTYFYTIVAPGNYTFCVNKSKRPMNPSSQAAGVRA